MFNSKAPSPGRVFYTVHMDCDRYILDAGSAHGVTDGAEFAVYGHRDWPPKTPPLGTLVVVDTSAFSASMFVLGASGFALNDSGFALQTKVGAEEDLRLHIAIDETFVSVFEALAQEMQRTGPDRRRILLSERDNAELDVELEDGQVVFNILDPLVTKFGLTRMPARIGVADVWPVLRAAAHYRWHLRRTNKKPIFQNKVRIEFKQLKGSRELQPYGPDLNVNGVIDFVVDEDAMYGIKIINDTAKPLYPSLFYFDNSDLSGAPSDCSTYKRS